MDFTLELVVVPVSDVDRAKAFYSERCGFNVDVDHSDGEDFRVVQLTPPARPARSRSARAWRRWSRARSRVCSCA
jgi:catechol 2,3-dioxygenase-like lactoylglutathione lyase family enzyme